MSTLFKFKTLLLVFQICLLAACSQTPRFVAPEIDPPSDLIPSYVPEGYEQISGFQIEVRDLSDRFIANGDNGRILCGEGVIVHFSKVKSPAGNDLLGIYYQDDDALLLITKSSFPGGSLESWQAIYEASYEDNCDSCCCLQVAIDAPLPMRNAEIREIRTINETQVAILEAELGRLITVFVRDEYLIAIDGDIPLEEHLRIIESLLND